MKKNKLIEKTLEQKLAMHFGVKMAECDLVQKEIDTEKRTIKAVANTYFFIDSDLDMLIPGCATKSIADRGPKSNAVAKIKHQADHILNTKNVVGRIDVLDEREIATEKGTFFGLYFESFIPETRKGNDDLGNYQEGLYDNHSIGFFFRSLQKAVKNSVDQNERDAWDEFLPKAINPEKAEEFGFFWVIKEIELFEISVVSYGANELTPTLGAKSKEDNEKLKIEIIERIDELNGQLKSKAEGKEEMKLIDINTLQLKQIITDLKLEQPSKKSTPPKEPDANDTDNGESQSFIGDVASNF